MIFQTHEANIPQIKAAIKAYDAVFFHGDGNIYPAVKKDGEWFSKESNDRQQFANPKQEEATYRKLFTSTSKIPGNVEELNKALMDSKNQDILHQRVIKEAAGIKTFSVEEEAPVLTPAGVQTPTTAGADTNIEDDGKIIDPKPNPDAVVAPATPVAPVEVKQNVTPVTGEGSTKVAEQKTGEATKPAQPNTNK